MPSMQEIWERIEAGFEAIGASAEFKHFQPGATDAEIDASEALLRITFPDEVRASYRIYRSSNRYDVIGDPDQFLYELYSLPEIVQDWQHEVSEHGDADWLYAQEAGVDEALLFGFDRRVRCYPPDRVWWWHPKWIPLLRSIGGERLCLDLAPGPAGQVGQIIKLDVHSGGPCPPVVASSWQALLSTFADDLAAGEYRLGGDSLGGFFLDLA